MGQKSRFLGIISHSISVKEFVNQFNIFFKSKFIYFPNSLFLSLLKAQKLNILHINSENMCNNPACCAEIYPAKSSPRHRKCFNNIQSLNIRQQMFLNSPGNYFQNCLNIAILLIISRNIMPFCLHFFMNHHFCVKPTV